MIARPLCVVLLFLALVGCAAPREQIPRETGLPPAAAGAPPAAMAAPEVDVLALRVALHEAAARDRARSNGL